MTAIYQNSPAHRRLIDALYVDAMVLADEARSYFDDRGRGDRDHLSPLARVSFSCESLKVTTRLMHIIAWLLTQRALTAGELSQGDALHPSRRLGPSPLSDSRSVADLPETARLMVEASEALYQRVARLDGSLGERRTVSPARAMIDRLAGAL